MDAILTNKTMRYINDPPRTEAVAVAQVRVVKGFVVEVVDEGVHSELRVPLADILHLIRLPYSQPVNAQWHLRRHLDSKCRPFVCIIQFQFTGK